MNILEMIAEWRKGCSDTTAEHPEHCPLCTLGLIEAIERRVVAGTDKAHWGGYCKGKAVAYGEGA